MKWIDFRLPWAMHVHGKHTLRTVDPETGRPEEQRYEATCEKCGVKWGPLSCNSGQVRQHIAKFAYVHLHREPAA